MFQLNQSCCLRRPNKGIRQINNTNSALAKPALARPDQKCRYNKSHVPYNTTSNNHQQSKNRYPPQTSFATERRGNKQSNYRNYMNETQ